MCVFAPPTFKRMGPPGQTLATPFGAKEIFIASDAACLVPHSCSLLHLEEEDQAFVLRKQTPKIPPFWGYGWAGNEVSWSRSGVGMCPAPKYQNDGKMGLQGGFFL